MSDTTQSLKDRFSAGKTPTSSDYNALIDAIPEGGGGTVDSAISSTSTNALQNRVLYNELRITDTTTRTVNAVDLGDGSQPREIITLDANDFYSYNFIQSGGSGDTEEVYGLPNSMQSDKAYIILNSEYKSFFHESGGTYLLKFCGSDESESVDAHIAKEDDAEPPQQGYVSLAYPETGYWNLINFNIYKDSTDILPDSGGTGYAVDLGQDGYSWMQSNATEGQTTITETSTKSLKQKIQELEARIAALEG